MGATARAIFQAHLDGLIASSLTPESLPIDLAWTFDKAVGQIIPALTLGTTPNALQVPSGATMLILVPPSTNVVPIVMGGAVADTGVALSPNCASIFSIAITPIILTVTMPVVVQLIWL